MSTTGQSRSSDCVIRPRVSPEQARDLLWELYGLKATQVDELSSYDDRNFHVTVEHLEVNNPHLQEVVQLREGAEFLLKFANSVDSVDTSGLAFQNEVMLYLQSQGMPVQRPLPNKSGALIEVHPLLTPVDIHGKMETRVHAVRLLTWLPGNILNKVPLTLELSREIGEVVGKLALLLQSFPISSTTTPPPNPSIWALREVPRLREFIPHIHGDERRALLNAVVTQFEQQVHEKEDRLKKGRVHGDLNDMNLLVSRTSSTGDGEGMWHVSGILDWQDFTTDSCLLYELGILIMYLMIATHISHPPQVTDNAEPSMLALVGRVAVQGYLQETTKNSHGILSPEELDLLPTVVMARFAQSLCIGEYTARVLEPDNTYVLSTAECGWEQLSFLWNQQDHVRHVWLGQDPVSGDTSK